LGILLDLRDLYFGKSPPEDEVALSGEPLRALQEILIRKGYYRGPAHGEYDSATRTSLEAFIGSENFEDRTDIPGGRIDRPVLDYLRAHFAEGS
jgi:peptidoglycan hydrolase-like protein with peptidoglycan-binding domain